MASRSSSTVALKGRPSPPSTRPTLRLDVHRSVVPPKTVLWLSRPRVARLRAPAGALVHREIERDRLRGTWSAAVQPNSGLGRTRFVAAAREPPCAVARRRAQSRYPIRMVSVHSQYRLHDASAPILPMPTRHGISCCTLLNSAAGMSIRVISTILSLTARRVHTLPIVTLTIIGIYGR
jgi:hypothetical protein